jgi:hypothetical protein
MMTEDGFEVTLDENDISFAMDSLIVRVVKVIKYGESRMVPKELAENPELLNKEIKNIMGRIEDRINCVH